MAVASVCGLASGLGLWFLPRATLVTTTAVAVGYLVQASIAGPVLPIALTIALYAATRRTDVERGARLVAVVVAALLLMATGLTVGHRPGLIGTYVVVALAGVVAGLVVALREERVLAARSSAAVAERLRIARDLHDIVGHGMGAITVQAGAGRVALEAGAVDDASRALAQIEASGRAVLREVRWLVGILRDETHPPTLADVPDLMTAFRRAGMQADVEIVGDVARASPEAGEAAYRIVQEALTNVLRHGTGHPVLVRVEVGDELTVDVKDSGTAPAVPAPDGNGLTGMRERAAAVGGVLVAGPAADGNGWAVHAGLPVRGSST
jgi:signal transduction histidine kinase